jgi:uncharacterized protein
MKFEWDENKNKINHRNHKIWFEEAQTVWADIHSSEFFDPDHSDTEDRLIRVGHTTRNRLVLVVFCERLSGTTIRIISARKATPTERNKYEKGI